MKTKLYHATMTDNINSIIEKGLIPGFTPPPGQDWLGKHSGKGIYFHSVFPEHELFQYTMLEPDSGDVGELDAMPIVIEVEFDDVFTNFTLDEEEFGWNHEPTSSEIMGALSKMRALVYLGKIPPENITAVHFVDREGIREYTKELCKYPEKLKGFFKESWREFES